MITGTARAGSRVRIMPAKALPLPPERPGEPASADLQRKRSSFTAPPDGSGPALDRTVIAGVPCGVVDRGPGPVVLYFHGGGYRMGNAAAYTTYASRIADAADVSVVVVDYRLAPEHPFPAAIRDGFAVYLDLREQAPDRRVVVAGDSAGGGLAAAISVAADICDTPRPDAQALLSPWLNLRCDAAGYDKATDSLFDRQTALGAREAYLQGHSTDDPLASPMRAAAQVFPPTLIQVGAAESLLPDSLDFAHKLADAGVSCALHVAAGQGHTWPVINPDGWDSRSAIAELGSFIRRSTRPRTSDSPSEQARPTDPSNPAPDPFEPIHHHADTPGES